MFGRVPVGMPACLLTSKHASEVGARGCQYDPVRAELGAPNVYDHVAQLLLPPQLLEHAKRQSFDVLGGVQLAVGGGDFGNVSVGLGATFCAVHSAGQARRGWTTGNKGLLEALWSTRIIRH